MGRCLWGLALSCAFLGLGHGFWRHFWRRPFRLSDCTQRDETPTKPCFLPSASGFHPAQQVVPLGQPPPVEAQQAAAPEKTARLACHRRHRAAKRGRRQRPGGRRKCVAGPDNGGAGGQQTVTRSSHDPSEKPCRQEMSTIVAALISSKAVCFR
jgi:hypothetical protein